MTADEAQTLADGIAAVRSDLTTFRQVMHRTSLAHDERLFHAEREWKRELLAVKEEIANLVAMLTEMRDADGEAREARQEAIDGKLEAIEAGQRETAKTARLAFIIAALVVVVDTALVFLVTRMV